ncbi:MAG: hypothetical protein ACRCZ0_02645 [Cetobacterium sp.]
MTTKQLKEILITEWDLRIEGKIEKRLWKHSIVKKGYTQFNLSGNHNECDYNEEKIVVVDNKTNEILTVWTHDAIPESYQENPDEFFFIDL